MARAKAKEAEVENETVEDSVDQETETEQAAEEAIDPIYEAIKTAFTQAVESELDEDGIKMAMIGAGAKFKNVAALYNKLLVELGFVKSKEEKAEILSDVLEGTDLTDETTFNDCVFQIMERAEVTDKSAAAMLRQWAKKNEVEYFKPEKPTAGEREGFTTKIFDWIKDNHEKSADDLVAYITSFDSGNLLKHKSRYVSALNMAKAIAAKYQA